MEGGEAEGPGRSTDGQLATAGEQATVVQQGQASRHTSPHEYVTAKESLPLRLEGRYLGNGYRWDGERRVP